MNIPCWISLLQSTGKSLVDEMNNIGSLRESFFLNQLQYLHKVEKAKFGDFKVNGRYSFEIGGKNKTYHQTANISDS